MCPHARPDWRMCPHCLGLNQEIYVYPCDMSGVVMEGPPEPLSRLKARTDAWYIGTSHDS
jgi:hypothetical protein